MQYIRSVAWALVLGLAGCLNSGRGLRDVGLAERCADIMQRAFPSATIDITKSEASATSLTTIIAHVEGVRSDMPAGGPLAHDLAVECRFDENILTEFHWTAGPTH